MKEIVGDIWEIKKSSGGWVCVPTNGVANSEGLAIMGAGLALQAANRYKDLPRQLGTKLLKRGNYVYAFVDDQLFTFPTKQNWRSDSDLDLIASSAIQLRDLVDSMYSSSLNSKTLLPRVGCGNGRLNWEKQVKPVLASILDDRFLVVNL